MKRTKVGDVIGLLLVVLSGVVLTYGIMHRLDLVATDDDVYFDNGLRAIYQHEPLPVQMAPLFSAWYLLIDAFYKNSIDTQYVSWALLSILPGVLFYFLLRSLRVGVVPSVALSVLFLYSPLNFPQDQKVSPFTMLWLMGGLIASNYQKNPVYKLTAAAAGALLATYARPEFFLSFLILCVVALGWYVWQRRTQARNSQSTTDRAALPYPLFGLMGIALILVVAFGSPLSGKRSIIAFSQHFAMNYAAWHPEINLSPWMHPQVYIRAGFGREVSSISEAFFLNPAMFMRHIWANVVALFVHTEHFVREMLLTPWLSRLAFPGRRYLLLAMLAAVIGLANWPQTGRKLIDGFRRDGWYWLCVFVVLLPTFISCILLLPRDHYVVFQMIIYVSLAGVLLRAYTLRSMPQIAPAVGYGVAVGLLGLFLWPQWQLSQQTKPTPTADVLRTLEKLPVGRPVTMTGNLSLMYRIYLGPDWKFVHMDRYRPTDVQAFLAKNAITCIHIQPDVLSRYANDPFFASLIANPAAAGYTKYPINNVPDQYVLVQESTVSIAHPPSIR